MREEYLNFANAFDALTVTKNGAIPALPSLPTVNGERRKSVKLVNAVSIFCGSNVRRKCSGGRILGVTLVDYRALPQPEVRLMNETKYNHVIQLFICFERKTKNSVGKKEIYLF